MCSIRIRNAQVMFNLNLITNMKRLFLLLALVTSFQVLAHEEHTKPQKTTLAVSVVADAAGQLWRASVKDGFVLVDKSSDMGKTFSKPVQVNLQAQKIGADGEARPKIAVSMQGAVYVTWSQMLGKPFTAYVWFARSLDGGKNFEQQKVVHQDRDEITHRFDALQVSPGGQITVLWVDKRDLEAAKVAGKKYDGAAIYYATSTDQGKSFAVEKKLADSSCECCRIVTTTKSDGTVVAMWRHVFEGSERDHMIAEVPQGNAKPNLQRATFGHWQIDGCPHHGAALTSGGEGKDWWGYHMAYFDGNDKKPGLYYSRMDGVAWASSVPKKFGNNKHQAGHPSILSVGEKVWLVWRETEAKHNSILGMYSEDGGRSWQDTKVLASTADKADYPQLLSKDGQAYLVWNTAKEGLRVLGL
jgi:hypothetical protein